MTQHSGTSESLDLKSETLKLSHFATHTGGY